MNATANHRPRTLDAVARRSQAGRAFDPLLREFLDEFYVADREQRQDAIASEPPRLTPVHDAYLAAVAEHLALRFRLDIPDWTENKDRFLDTPFFAGGLEGLKALLLVESPLAFRRRQVFVSRDALSRPRDPDRARKAGAPQ
jgi:hypothetical protein